MSEVTTRPATGATKHRTPPPAQVADPQPAGFSALQCELAFNTICSQAEVLRDFLTDAMDRFGRDASADSAARDFRMAVQLASLIGAMADHMGGCTHLGSVAAWTCGDDMEPEVSA